MPSLDSNRLRTTFEGVGEIDAFIVASGFNEMRVMSFGMTWPETWGRGIWQDCAWLKIGDIVRPGDNISIAWKDCVPGPGPIIVGWLTLKVTTPGTIEIIPSEKEEAVAIVNCERHSPKMSETMINLKGGAGGAKGDDPARLRDLTNRNWYIRPDSSGDAKTLAQALKQAIPGDTILVSQGVYSESVTLRQGVVVLGSWNGMFTNRDLSLWPTIIDASGREYGVRSVFAEDRSAVFDGFIVRGASGESAGGGIILKGSSSPTLRNLVIHSNWGELGGGIYCHASTPLIENVLVAHNRAMQGGGIYCTMGASPRIGSATLVANEAPEGGAIFAARGASPFIENSVIADHVAGWAVYCDPKGSRVSLSCCNLWNNLPSDFGGGATEDMLLKNNSFEEPLFVNPSRLDFTLSKDSPCLSVKGCGRLGAAHARIPGK
jgi:hypothetical protein